MTRFIKFVLLRALAAFLVLLVLFHGVSYILYAVGLSSEYLGIENFKRNYYIIVAASLGWALGEFIYKSDKKRRV